MQLCSYGLIASGYDLYDCRDANVVHIVNLIQEAFLAAVSIKQYFAQARSEQISVNPYWPKGSGVVTASLFINSGSNRLDLSKYLQHEGQAASNIVWREYDYQQWISQLPEILSMMDNLNLDKVDAALRELLQEYSIRFQTCIVDTTSILNDFLDDRISVDELIYIPNVLLAPELTDYVHVGNQLYVLATEPRINSMIHELLHDALHEDMMAISATKLTILLKQADLKKLQELGYSWDSSEESNRRIVEESLVRCITVMLESESDQIREEKLQFLRREGFIIPFNVSSLSREKLTLKKARELIVAI